MVDGWMAHWGSRGMFAAAVIAAALMLLPAANASATSGKPINIGTPLQSGPPAVAVGNDGTGYFAWANTQELAGGPDTVQYCVLPAGATSCVHSGTLTPADSASHVDNVQVLVDGTTVVLLADVYGTAGPSAADYAPEQEWQSTDGGASFNIVNGGKSVAQGILNADTEPLSAVIVPGANALGYGWNTAGSSPPTFAEFPLTSPPECSEAAGHRCPFAALEPNTNPDQISNAGGQFASQGGANPGVIGVFNTDFTSGPLGCSNAKTVPFGTAFAYGSGPQSPTNNYNIDPGKPNSAWKVAVTQADCNVDYVAVAGGPSGFGVVEDNEAIGAMVYHRFDQATQSFDTPQVTISTLGEQDPAVSQDGSGGIYTTYLAGGLGGPIALSYSYDAGSTWVTGTLNPNTDTAARQVTSSVNSAGQGFVAWTDNGSVFAQQFVAADAVPPPAADTITTSQTAGTTTGTSISVPVGTIGETDKATVVGANAASAGGTMSYGLYAKSTCTPSSKVFSGGPVTVAGGVAAASPGVTAALAPGDYYWQAVFSGNPGNVFTGGGNLASASTCGAEMLTLSAPVTINAHAKLNHKRVTIKLSCVSATCKVKVVLTITKHHKTIQLGSGKFTVKSTSTKTLKIRLTKAGRKFFASHHGTVKCKVVVTDQTSAGPVKTTKTIKVRVH